MKTETLHYGYALVMLIGIWMLRKGFTGVSHTWWMIAFWIQFWHHIEHALLQIPGADAPQLLSFSRTRRAFCSCGSRAWNFTCSTTRLCLSPW